MKFLLILIASVMMLQLSLASSLRNKPNDFSSNDPLMYYKTTKALVKRFEPLIKDVLEDLPSSEAFSLHRNNLENYLTKAENSKTNKEICFIKVFQMLQDFIELLTPYKDGTPSDEAKQVWAMFIKHGYNELDKEFKEFVEGYDAEAFDKRIENLNEADDYELFELC